MSETTKRNDRVATREKPRLAAFGGALLFGPVGVVLVGITLVATLFVIGFLITPFAPQTGEGLMGLGLFLTFVVVYALLFGAPSYALVFGPVAWLASRRGTPSPMRFALLGVAANLIAWPIMIVVVAGYTGDMEAGVDLSTFVHGFGFIFAPIYAASFGWALKWSVGETPPASSTPAAA